MRRAYGHARKSTTSSKAATSTRRDDVTVTSSRQSSSSASPSSAAARATARTAGGDMLMRRRVLPTTVLPEVLPMALAPPMNGRGLYIYAPPPPRPVRVTTNAVRAAANFTTEPAVGDLSTPTASHGAGGEVTTGRGRHVDHRTSPPPTTTAQYSTMLSVTDLIGKCADRSIVFASWRPYHLSSRESALLQNGTRRSVQPFLQSSRSWITHRHRHRARCVKSSSCY